MGPDGRPEQQLAIPVILDGSGRVERSTPTEQMTMSISGREGGDRVPCARRGALEHQGPSGDTHTTSWGAGCGSA